ncbi:MAG: riboflavin synthase [Verrucomicrobiaceae bacterium]|nr:riboflavin synthase [Verrucomicrobiaceae bacterium]
MFTGLVESTARVTALDPRGDGARLMLEAAPGMADVTEGDSVAVNGCCLTVTSFDALSRVLSFDLLGQTLRVTNLGNLRPEAEVNVERALRVGDRLGGHFVQGHVDATATILHWGPQGADYKLTLEMPDEANGLVIPKGSVCLDGISLTAAEVTPGQISCWIIPHTRAVTNLRRRVVGERVNVEFDMLGKYVRQLLAAAR